MRKSVQMAGAMMMASASPAYAGGSTVGRITSLHTYEGHNGLLVRIDPMINPDNCRPTYLILPDSNKQAQFIQSVLLSARLTNTRVTIWVDGCFENYSRIVHTHIGD